MTPGRRRLFTMILVVGLVVFTEAVFAALLHLRPNLEQARRRMAGEPLTSRFSEQVYLDYVPSPNFEGHSPIGTRGRAIALAKPANTLRVVCLGGSTTYGTAIRDADETYPAHLERELQALVPEGTTVEVVNGGVATGTTALLLTHYLFKWRYFEPDLVVINTGGNDATPLLWANYHPDYSHWRRPVRHVQPLSGPFQWLARSRTLGAILAVAVYGGQAGEMLNVSDQRAFAGLGAETVWYPETREPWREVPEEHFAFHHNLNHLVRAIGDDGTDVLLVPFRLSPTHDVGDSMRAAIERDEKALRAVAAENNLPIAPFPAEVISEGNWMDLCHLNPAGAAEKARHIAPFAAQALAERLAKDDGEAAEPMEPSSP